jgi:hypothetical protein
MNRREVHYHLRRLPTCVVVVAAVPGELEVELVPHIVHHSPTGMEFGYAGSGPADLALSLLTFHLQADPVRVKLILTRGVRPPHLDELDPAVRAVRLYQAFKDHALAGRFATEHGIDLTGWSISQWIEARERKEAEAAKIIERTP